MALEKEKNYEMFSNSDDKGLCEERRLLKRKHPVTFNDVDLNEEIKKIKGMFKVFAYKFKRSVQI